MKLDDQGVQEDLSQVLDEAISRLQRGEGLEECLSHYPAFAAELEPLLLAVGSLQRFADVPLPSELEDWASSQGAAEFRQLTTQALPSTNTSEVLHSAPDDQHLYLNQADIPVVLPNPGIPFVEALDAAIAEVRTYHDISQSLARYPDHADELSPLLTLSNQIQQQADEPLPAEMEEWVATEGQAQFAALVAQRSHKRRARHQPALRSWQRMLVAVVIAALLIRVVDTASAASLPGEPLYSWKRAQEGVSLALTSNAHERGELYAEFAQRRADEIRALVDNGTPLDSPLVLDALLAISDHALKALNEAELAGDTATIEPQVKKAVSQVQSVVATGVQTQSENTTLQDMSNQLEDIQNDLSPTSDTAEIPVPSTTINAVPSTATTVEPPKTPTLTNPTQVLPQHTTVPQNNSGSNGSGTNQPKPSSTVQPNEPPPATAIATPLPSIVIEPIAPTSTPAPTSTSVPTERSDNSPSQPTHTPVPPTATSVPTATPVPATEPPTSVPTEPPPPTRQPRPTRTPVPTNTAVPTDTPVPTAEPTVVPTIEPTTEPTVAPTTEPTAEPTTEPTVAPTIEPTAEPTTEPATETPAVTPDASSESETPVTAATDVVGPPAPTTSAESGGKPEPSPEAASPTKTTVSVTASP